jgi:CrcB protein
VIAVEVLAAGFVGALCRYVVDAALQQWTRSSYPLGTLAVNLTGALVIGVVAGAAIYHHLGAEPEVVIATGFLGAYTTFSTLTLESLRLAEDGSFGLAAANLAVSLVGGVALAAAGLAMAAVV